METPQTVLYYDLVLEVWGASMDPECGAQTRTVDCIVLGELSRFLVLMRAFGVLPMVPLEILPMVPLVANGTIGLPLVTMVPLGGPIIPLTLPLVTMVLPMVPLVEH